MVVMKYKSSEHCHGPAHSPKTSRMRKYMTQFFLFSVVRWVSPQVLVVIGGKVSFSLSLSHHRVTLPLCHLVALLPVEWFFSNWSGENLIQVRVMEARELKFCIPVPLEGVSVGKLLLKNLLFNVFWVPVTIQKLIKTNLLLIWEETLPGSDVVVSKFIFIPRLLHVKSVVEEAPQTILIISLAEGKSRRCYVVLVGGVEV